MKTVTVQIGNSDDKLSQKRWSAFIVKTWVVISIRCNEEHFAAGSPSYTAWQNYCHVFTIDDACIKHLKEDLRVLREEFGQDSIAITIGETEFV